MSGRPVCQNPRCWSTGGSHSSAHKPPIHPFPPMPLAGVLSEAQHLGETQTPGSTSLCTPPLVLADASQSAAEIASSERTHAGSTDSAATHTSCPWLRLLSVRCCEPAGCPAPGNRPRWYTSQCVYASRAPSPAVLLIAGSPPHTRASPATGHAEPNRATAPGWGRGPD